jgi:hypothetical protein
MVAPTIGIVMVVLRLVTAGQGEWRSTELMRLEVMVGPVMQLSVMQQVLIQILSWATEEMEVLLRVRFPVLRVEMAVTIVLQPGL